MSYAADVFVVVMFAGLIVCLVGALYSFARVVWDSRVPRISWKQVAEEYARRFTGEGKP